MLTSFFVVYEPIQATRQSRRRHVVLSKISLEEKMKEDAIRRQKLASKYKKEETKTMTQAERLLEAAKTEEENMAWLHRFDRLDQERRKTVASQKSKRKTVSNGPTVRWSSFLEELIVEGNSKLVMESNRIDQGVGDALDAVGDQHKASPPSIFITRNYISFKSGADEMLTRSNLPLPNSKLKRLRTISLCM